MEILGFNLLHWTTSTLPWENISDPKVVEEKKKSLMVSFASSSKKLIPSAPPGKIMFILIYRMRQTTRVQCIATLMSLICVNNHLQPLYFVHNKTKKIISTL